MKFKLITIGGFLLILSLILLTGCQGTDVQNNQITDTEQNAEESIIKQESAVKEDFYNKDMILYGIRDNKFTLMQIDDLGENFDKITYVECGYTTRGGLAFEITNPTCGGFTGFPTWVIKGRSINGFRTEALLKQELAETIIANEESPQPKQQDIVQCGRVTEGFLRKQIAAEDWRIQPDGTLTLTLSNRAIDDINILGINGDEPREGIVTLKKGGGSEIVTGTNSPGFINQCFTHEVIIAYNVANGNIKFLTVNITGGFGQ